MPRLTKRAAALGAAALAAGAAVTVVLWGGASESEDPVCGGQLVAARYARGDIDDTLLSAPAAEFSHRLGCLFPREIQKDHERHSQFFYAMTNPQDAMDPKNGIEASPIFFFVGHGASPMDWTTGDDSATQLYMHLGDPEVGSRLRYYFQCSCRVFAHGKYQGQLAEPEYPVPWTLDHGPDDDKPELRSVYRRWGKALATGIRLACGLSTTMPCSAEQIERVMKDKQAFADVADSFLEGMQLEPGDVPLCITKDPRPGAMDPDPQATPLYDKFFALGPRVAQGDDGPFYYVEYLRPSRPRPRRMLLPARYRILPNFAFAAPSPTTDVQKMSEPAGSKVGRFLKQLAAHIVERWNDESRVYFDPRVKLTPLLADCPREEKCGDDDRYIDLAKAFLRDRGWEERTFEPQPEVLRLVVDSYSTNAFNDPLPVIRFQKGVMVRFWRALEAAPRAATDETDTVVVVLNHRGEVANAWKRWRRLVPAGHFHLDAAAIAALDNEALKQLDPQRARYRPTSGPELIFKEERGKKDRGKLTPFMRYRFDPVSPEYLAKLPVRRVDVEVESIVRRAQ
jgi:hypothetical protein